ncbi:MAG TPA: putative nucleotide-diphospho-sugar transferase [Longimicrobiales bacterium]
MGSRRLEEAVRAAEVDGRVILVFADEAYGSILANWLAAVDRLDLGGYLVVALDRPTERWLAQRGVPRLRPPAPRRPALGLPVGPVRARRARRLWSLRLDVIRQVLALGVDVVHSDADAVWLRDPMGDPLGASAEDLVISQGTTWPREVHGRWGFVVCCGLFQVRANDVARRLLAEVAEDLRETGDDQASLNRVLARRDVRWEAPSPYRLEYDRTEIVCSREPLLGRAGPLTVAVLPHHLFQRIHRPAEAPYVKHLLAPKESRAKEEALKAAGCWFLPLSP